MSTRRKPDRPVRMELFGDEIESIRKFEPDSQRSSTAIERPCSCR